MGRRIKKLLRWMLPLWLLLGLTPFVVHAAPSDTTVSLTPSSPTVNGCDTQEIQIWVNDVTNFYAIDVRLSFDPAVIEIVDGDTGRAGVNLRPETTWFKAGFTVRNEANNFAGTIWYAATQTSPTPALTGSGPIATILVKAKSSGTTSLNFTFRKLSTPTGIEIPAGISNGSVTGSSPPVPALTITRLNITDVRLNWTAQSGVSGYRLYRSTLPYFYAVEPPYQSTTGTSYDDTGVLGSEVTNYFYTVRSVCTDANTSAASNQVGKFEYRLYETTGTDFTWVGLPLMVPGMVKASDLANHVENNSNASVTVLTVSSWNPPAQNTTSYSHQFNSGDFDVVMKFPYRLNVDVGIGSQVVWVMVGDLPAITTDIYTLYETTGTDFTWVLQPLELTTITTSSALASNIQTNASAPAAVLTISQWNAGAQNVTTYNHQLGSGLFSTRFGYPYRVEVDISSGSSVTWP